jgi:hypothetical protein
MKCNTKPPVSLTKKQRDVLKEEIKNALVRKLEEYDREFDAIVLWVLREQLGFGKKRLERFYKMFFALSRELKNRYEEESPGLPAMAELKKIGVDVVEWANKYST